MFKSIYMWILNLIGDFQFWKSELGIVSDLVFWGLVSKTRQHENLVNYLRMNNQTTTV